MDIVTVDYTRLYPAAFKLEQLIKCRRKKTLGQRN
jgi:hypothetical protein